MSSSSDALLIRDVVVDGVRCDCRVLDGLIVELGPDLSVPPTGRVVDAAGGSLLPGLHDHHVHAFAAAAAAASLDLHGGPLPLAPAASSPESHGEAGWVRAVGLGDDDVTVADLDRVWPDRPVRVQHRSGALWVLNTRAIDLLGDVLEPRERADGRVWRGDGRLAAALARHDPRDLETGLREWGHRLASWGVTGLTDATVDLSVEGLARIRDNVPQRVVSLGAEDDGLPVKIIAGDHGAVHGHDEWSELVSAVGAARDRGRPVAVHAVSASSLALVLAVLDELGVVEGDRVEHAAVCDDAGADRLVELGLTVVTQPSIAARRGRAMIEASAPEDRPWLWRVRGLRERGVRVVLSSDAPYGDADPWVTIRLAGAGLPPARSPWLADQTISPRAALASYLTVPDDPAGAPRHVEVGGVADLCVLDGPLEQVLERVVTGEPGSPVLLTIVDGQVVSRRPGCSDAGA